MQRLSSSSRTLQHSTTPTLHRSAFTLVEVLVTIVILSTGIVVVLRALESSVVALGESREVLYGTMLARRKLAEIESELEEGNSSSVDASGWFEDDFENYRWMVKSVPFASVAAAGGDEQGASLHEVNVTAWRDGRDEKQTIATCLRY